MSQNTLQTINVSEVLTIQFWLQSSPEQSKELTRLRSELLGGQFSRLLWTPLHRKQVTRVPWIVILKIVSFHCTRAKNKYLTAVKLITLSLLQIKYWTFWYMDHFASIKFNLLENAWNDRNLWKVNNGWIAMLVWYCFIRPLQKYLTVTSVLSLLQLSTEQLSILISLLTASL